MPETLDDPFDDAASEATATGYGGGTVGLLARSLCSAAAGQGSGLCLAAAQLAAQMLRTDAADPHWPDRDRIAAEPALAGFAAALERLSGAQGLCTVLRPAVGGGVGLALAERMLAARFGRSLVDHRSWVFCTAATLATGAVQEAAWLAGAWRLGRLTVLAEAAAAPVAGLAGFAANGWAVRHAQADDAAEVASALSAALRSVKPTLILCEGPGVAPASVSLARPGEDGAAAWAAAACRLAGVRRGWLKRLARHAGRQDFERAMAGRPHGRWHAPLSEPESLLPAGSSTVGTAQTVRTAIAALAATMPDLALLPGADGWRQPSGQAEPPVASAAAAGRLAAGMGAALCGVALHGGLVAIGVQDAAGADDLLPALRAAAAADTRLVQILIEPPQPEAEQPLAALRAMANLAVFRPADASEAIECLELALRQLDGPSVLLLSDATRRPLADRPARTRSARGGYVVAEAEGVRAVTLIASGTELEPMLLACRLLAARGLPAAAVALPCWGLFARQDAAWRSQVLGNAPRVACEPGAGFGWERWLGPRGLFLPAGAAPAAIADAVARHLGAAPMRAAI